MSQVIQIHQEIASVKVKVQKDRLSVLEGSLSVSIVVSIGAEGTIK